MVKDITKTGCQYGKTYGVPLFHSPGVFWAHRNMIRKCGLRKEDFNDPLDCFRWGDILQSSKLCAHGFSFFGFIYHAANYGIDIRREGNEFRMDPGKVKKFFIECSKHLEHRYTFLNSSTHITSLFHRGQQGIKAAYLNSLSTVEKRFELLGQPLKKNGFSCQTIFLLAMGKNTQHEDVVYDFLRFLLMDHIQELFISPETNFSVINRVYQRQYKELKESAKVNIPPFDFRGIYPMMDLDLLAFVARYLYLETVEVLLNFKDIDKAVESICRINIPERRKYFLENASKSQQLEYAPYIRYLKEINEL